MVIVIKLSGFETPFSPFEFLNETIPDTLIVNDADVADPFIPSSSTTTTTTTAKENERSENHTL